MNSPDKETSVIFSGFKELDHLTSGFGKGDLVVVGSRPAVGKTSFVLSVVENVLLRTLVPVNTYIFTLEYPKSLFSLRLLALAAEKNFYEIRDGELSEKERQEIGHLREELEEAPVIIDDTAAVTPGHIRDVLLSMDSDGKKPELVIIDYLQLMNCGGECAWRGEEIEMIMRSLKDIAKECAVPIVVTSQLRRRDEATFRPLLSDFEPNIEPYADTVILIGRESMHKADGDKGKAELFVPKNRNGETGRIGLSFEEYGRFREG